jgi:hypothetical protein
MEEHPIEGGELSEEHPIKGEEIKDMLAIPEMDIPTGKPEEPYTK